MKASEMTDEELANECESVAAAMEKYGGKGCGTKLREAAVRLRKQGKIMKVAEDALIKLKTIYYHTEYSFGRSICDGALAAIREEGDENGK